MQADFETACLGGKAIAGNPVTIFSVAEQADVYLPSLLI
jgi:hypothetical protein